jgi:hypothetical protein
MEQLFATYGDRAAMFVVYIAEAHAVDGWQVAPNVQDGVCIAKHRTIDERRDAARRCTSDLGITVPALVDGMDDATCMAYSAWPDRIYVVGTDGRIAFKGAPGPWGFRVTEAAVAVQQLLDHEDASRGDSAGTDALSPARQTAAAPPPAPPPVLRAFRGPGFFTRGGHAASEMDNVAEAWQLDDGRVYLRALNGEERVVKGYIGGVALAEGQLVLVDSPEIGGLPALRRQALDLHGGTIGETGGETCPLDGDTP